MANAIGNIYLSYSSSASIQFKNFKTKITRENSKTRICYISASSTVASDPYQTLRVCANASKSEVKKAFRQLALRYHPDVCRGNNDGVQFHHINEAYDLVMSQLREESAKPTKETYEPYNEGTKEAETGMDDPDLELWEEWMGWEGAGIRDYSSHINPYL